MWRKCLTALTLTASSLGAVADPASFVFDLSGSVYVQFDPEFCPNCAPYYAPWTGTLSIELADSNDGIYTDAAILAVSMASNLTTWSTDGFGVSKYVNNAPHDFVTLSAGQIVDMGGYYASGPDKAQQVFFTLASASLLDGLPKSAQHEAGTAVLTIPEPGTFELLLIGAVALFGWLNLAKRVRHGSAT